jgi:hypothetical protein
MTVEVKTHPSHPASMSQRVADRLKPSTCEGADEVVTHGSGARRTVSSVYHSGHKVQENTQAKPTDGRVASHAESKSQQTGGAG